MCNIFSDRECNFFVFSLTLQIQHSSSNKGGRRKIRYTHISFDNLGLLLAAANQKGEILILDFVNNKYWTIQTQTSCCALKFSIFNDCEVIVGTCSGEIRILNIESGEIVEILNFHKYPILNISFSYNFLCITCSCCEAVIWDLKSNIVIQVLNIFKNVFLRHVSIF